MSNRIFYFSLVALSLAALAVSVFLGRKIHAQTHVLHPFTAEYAIVAEGSTEQHFPVPFTKHRVFRRFETFAVRPDGSSVTIKHFDDGTMTAEVLDVSTRRVTFVDSATESTMTTAWTRDHQMKPAGESCTGEDAELILGLHTHRSETVRDISSGDAKGESNIRTWLSPELNCLEAGSEENQTILDHSRSGGTDLITSKQTKTLLSVKFGEPDSALFEIPKAYIERKPSELSGEFQRRYHRAPFSANHAARLDERYLRDHH